MIASWGRSRSGQRWHQLWSRLSASVGWRCTCSFASPVCLQIVCSAIWARKASGRVLMMKHSRVSFYRRLHLFMPRKLKTLLLLLTDLGAGFLIRYCISSIAAHENRSWAILAISKARDNLDCSSCTRPPCLAIVTDMLKTFRKIVAASNNEIRLLPQQYTLP